jgi:hypothetical protein
MEICKRWTMPGWVLGLLLTLSSPPIWAQAAGTVRIDPTPTLQATSPASKVPAVIYRSPFGDWPVTPVVVQDWRAANATVGRNPNGHTDVLRWEKAQVKP